jgi:CRISPR-associated protein (TIGR03986 family)
MVTFRATVTAVEGSRLYVHRHGDDGQEVIDLASDEVLCECEPDDLRPVEIGGGLHDFRLVEVERDDSGTMVTLLAGIGREHKVQAVGGRGNTRLRLHRSGGDSREYPLADLGVATDGGLTEEERQREAQRVQRLTYIVVSDDPMEGHWNHPGGLDAWRSALADEDRERQEQQKAKEVQQARQRAGDPKRNDDRFINPYTFVPFPEGDGDEICPRSRPAGHDHLGPDELAGRLRLRITTRTPLLTRAGLSGADAGRFPRRPTPDGERPFLPGSSLKGAVRSLHETLAGGCLRVVDLDFVPVYREQPTPRGGTDGWTLGSVEHTDDDGFPLEIRLAERVVWVEASVLHHALGGPERLRTGARVGIDLDRTSTDGARTVLRDPAGCRPEGEWVVLVTDAGARSRERPYYAACGLLGDRVSRPTEHAWDRFLLEVEGADDLRRQRQNPTADREAEVRHGDRLIGYRRRLLDRRLDAGDVIWVHEQGSMVDRIALANVWRSLGSGPVRERIPEALQPCTDPERLCPSCRLFGSADTEGRGRGEEARQDSYRGHVRISDAVAVTGTEPERIRLAPLGQPRPGAGQFYLRNTNDAGASHPGERPTREWGAAPDAREPRRLRGRKVYWHADPAEQQLRRWEPRQGLSDAMATEAEVVPPGTGFEATVWFEGLTIAEVGGLLSALDPRLLLTEHAPPGFRDEVDIANRLGGGKPFGFGTVDVEVTIDALHTAASRYGEDPPVSAEPAELVAAFRESTPAPVRKVWPALAAVLDVGHINPKFVAYPPGAPWTRAATDAFVQGFEFWKNSSGRYLNTDRDQTRMVLLPDPVDIDQSLPRSGKAADVGG